MYDVNTCKKTQKETGTWRRTSAAGTPTPTHRANPNKGNASSLNEATGIFNLFLFSRGARSLPVTQKHSNIPPPPPPTARDEKTLVFMTATIDVFSLGSW